MLREQVFTFFIVSASFFSGASASAGICSESAALSSDRSVLEQNLMNCKVAKGKFDSSKISDQNPKLKALKAKAVRVIRDTQAKLDQLNAVRQLTEVSTQTREAAKPSYCQVEDLPRKRPVVSAKGSVKKSIPSETAAEKKLKDLLNQIKSREDLVSKYGKFPSVKGQEHQDSLEMAGLALKGLREISNIYKTNPEKVEKFRAEETRCSNLIVSVLNSINTKSGNRKMGRYIKTLSSSIDGNGKREILNQLDDLEGLHKERLIAQRKKSGVLDKDGFPKVPDQFHRNKIRTYSNLAAWIRFNDSGGGTAQKAARKVVLLQ